MPIDRTPINDTAHNDKPRDSVADDIYSIEADAILEITAAIGANDIPKVYSLVPQIALMAPAVWGPQRSRLLAKFGSSLSIRALDQSIRDEKQRQFLPFGQPRNGASAAEGDWQAGLIRSDLGKMLPCMENVALHLQYHSDWDGVVGYNELTAGYEIRRHPPAPVTGQVGTELEDYFDTEATRWLECKGLMVKPQTVRMVVDAMARRCSYHPVRDYLNALPEWDGTPRIGSWLIDYCGVASGEANPNLYAAAVGEKFLIAAIARVFQPGCKVDHTLILEGEQGCGKSTTARILAGEWFTDQLDALGGKDAMMQLRGVWIVELPELDVLGRAEMSRAKAFLTAQIERFRVPYGKRVIQVPRQCVFLGTTNHDTWLKDETGGRRFWPVRCGRIDLDGLARDRDQLWAEAMLRYREGARWWLEDASIVREAQREQSARYQEDPWQDDVVQAANSLWESTGGASMRDILQRMAIEVSRRDQAAANRVSRCLKVAKWDRYQHRYQDGTREWRYRPGAIR